MSSFVHHEEFRIIGISIRTTNENGQSQKDIGDLWNRFISENLIEQIPNKKSYDVYCIYTDYENDFNGAYTAILGCRATSFENIPEVFIGKIIAAARYEVYTSKGKLPDCVIATWFNIWKSNINRSYIADFDIYGVKALDPENAEVEIYVSIK